MAGGLVIDLRAHQPSAGLLDQPIAELGRREVGKTPDERIAQQDLRRLWDRPGREVDDAPIAGQEAQLLARRRPAERRRPRHELERRAPVLADLDAQRRQDRKPGGRFAGAQMDGVGEERHALGGQAGGAMARQQLQAEPRQGLRIAALGGPGQAVHRVFVSALRLKSLGRIQRRRRILYFDHPELIPYGTVLSTASTRMILPSLILNNSKIWNE
jgi:hypothetical protein